MYIVYQLHLSNLGRLSLLLSALNDLVLRVELETDTVDAMSLVRRRRVSLSLENVSQMPSTVCAHNLRPRHA